jgi:DNA mismatch endonuclease (patch repair protein)
VHGCFWHRHEGCNQATTPKTHTKFWQDKFDKNVVRDKRNIEDLETLGWNVVIASLWCA